jgi:hypothetical protein
LLTTFNLQPSTAFAQGTAFTYQGRLNDGAGPATGLYDFRFAVYDDANAGGIQSTPVFATLGVTNGLFTTTLNFGGSVFNGGARWLEINVRTNGAVDYATLAPRQPVTPAPYAIYAAAAGGVNAAGITGTLAPAQLPDGTLTNNAGGVTLSGSFTGSGGSLTGVNAATLNGTVAAGFWQLGGNMVAPGQFLGSTNNQPVEIWAGGQRALRLEPNTNGAPNIIGGSSVNYIASGVEGSTIAGGGATNLLGIYGPYTNSVSANYSFLGGGWGNSIQSNADNSFLGSGVNNSIQPYADYSFLGGGEFNIIQTDAHNSAIAGGFVNTIQTNAGGSVIGGGYYNTIQTDTRQSAIGGGEWNTIQHNAGGSVLGGGYENTIGAPYSVVPGGDQNFAGGTNSFAAGHRAKANYAGDFVWADAQDADFNSTATNQFSVRAAGGVRFVTGGAGLTVDGAPVLTSGNGLTIQTNATGAPDIIGGSPVNFIAPGVYGSVVAGGGATGNSNSISANYSFLGGGSRNSIQTNATQSFLGGGWNNSIQPDAMSSFLGGGFDNSIQTNAFNSFLGGGNDNSIEPNAFASFLGGGEFNSIQPNVVRSVLVGGDENSIQTNAGYCFLGGGMGNSIQTGDIMSFIGGGEGNSIQPNADFSFLGGGLDNYIQPNANYSFLGGGWDNSILTNASWSFLGGGYLNSNSAPYSVVPGGDRNFAGGTNSFAAGHRAKANYAGDFVWADSQDTDFNSTVNNQFLIRAANGVGINKANPASALDVNGTVTATSFAGGGSGLTSLNAANLSGPVPSASLTSLPAANLTGSVPSAALTSVPAASLTGTVNDAQLSSNVPLLNAGQNSFAGDVRVNGMLRLGSETNTASGPSYPSGSTGLILRRISSTDSTTGKLVACTDAVQLQRDGSPAGLQIAYNAVSHYQTVNAFGITTNGTQVIYRNALHGGSGTLAMFTDAQKVVHYDISFGNPYNNGHTCHVVLDRYDDGNTSDNFLVGTITTTYNQ